MKRFITYIAIAAALTAVSCSRDITTKDAPGNGGVTIKLFCTDLQTRATAGDNTYNENLIDHFDYFFFEDAEGTTPLYPHARVSGENATFLTDVGDPFEGLREGGYVYILANYPELIPADVQTLEQVLALPVHTDMMKDFAATNPNPNGFIMDNLGANGNMTRFRASTANENTVVNIGLSRLAVKMTMVLNIAKEVAGAGDEKFTPATDADHLFVYFVNADSTNTVAATPLRRADGTADAPQDGYFTYNTTHDYTVGEDDASSDYIQVTTAPSYTYPQKWNAQDNGEPYYKIQVGWVSSITGLAPYYYKIPVPVPATDGVFTLNRNTWYQLTLTLKVLGGTQEDYVYVEQEYCVADFADWSSPSDVFGTTNDSAHYFDVPTLNYDIYSTDHVDINFVTEATARAEITSIEYYDYSGNGSTLVPRTPANGTYNAASQSYSYNHQTEGRTYSLAVNSDEQYVRFTHDIKNLYTVRVIKVLIFKEGEPNLAPKEVTITQHPAIELKKAGAGNVFVNGYFARVANAVDNNGNTLGALSNGYYHCRTGWNNGFVSTAYGNIWDGTGGASGGISSDFYTTDIVITAFNDGSENENDANNFYEVSETGATSWTGGMTPKTYYYKIGDPRLPASSVVGNWALEPYLYDETNNGNASTSAWTQPGGILICGQDEVRRSIIAPHFLVSSALNAMNQYVNFDEAVKRAATYQEVGYPAGRWRLPTEAEMAFIVARQNDDTLPNLYADDTDYWSGSGRVLNVSSTNGIRFRAQNGTETHSCRFVYDLWYWGDSPAAGNYSQNQYHPNGHIVSYK